MCARPLLCASCLLTLLACGQFGAAAPDGGGAEGGGVQGDAKDGGPCTAMLCEGFDTPTWPNLWDRSNANGMDRLQDPTAPSTPYVLQLLLANGEGPKWISFSVRETFTEITASARMKVRTRGAGEVDFFTIGTSDQAPDGIPVAATIAHSPSGFKVEASQQTGPTSTGTFATFDDWTRVVITLTRRPSPTAVFQVGGAQYEVSDVDPKLLLIPLRLAVGATWSQGVSAPWDVVFDDVTLDVKR